MALRLFANEDRTETAPPGVVEATAAGLTPFRELSEADLMAGVGRGDDTCHAELQRRYREMIVAYAASLLDPDLAEDVAQEVFLRVAAHAARWQPVGPLRTYLLHIARNIALNERRRLRNRTTTLDAARPTLARNRPATPGELLDEHELRAGILTALEAMPERRRDVFGLIRFGGLSYAEAAAVMGTSPQTVANQMSAAMADLRRAIEILTDERT